MTFERGDRVKWNDQLWHYLYIIEDGDNQTEWALLTVDINDYNAFTTMAPPDQLSPWSKSINFNNLYGILAEAEQKKKA